MKKQWVLFTFIMLVIGTIFYFTMKQLPIKQLGIFIGIIIGLVTVKIAARFSGRITIRYNKALLIAVVAIGSAYGFLYLFEV